MPRILRILYAQNNLQPLTKIEMHDVIDRIKFSLFDVLDTTLPLGGKTYSLRSEYIGIKTVKNNTDLRGIRPPLQIHFSVQEVISFWIFWKPKPLLYQLSWDVKNPRLNELNEILWKCHVEGINEFTKTLPTT